MKQCYCKTNIISYSSSDIVAAVDKQDSCKFFFIGTIFKLSKIQVIAETHLRNVTSTINPYPIQLNYNVTNTHQILSLLRLQNLLKYYSSVLQY